MKVLCTIVGFNKEARKQFTRAKIKLDFKPNISQAFIGNIIGNYDAILVGLGINLCSEILEKGVRLKIIATATTGLDHIDLKYAARKQIKIISLKNERAFLNNITGTAELAIGLVLNWLRKIHPAVESVLSGNWDRNRFIGNNLSGKTLGIVGLGRLGSMMAKYGLAFGMRVIFYDKTVISDKKISPVTFHRLLRESDIISIHVPLDANTTGMFTMSEFSKMKPTALLVNTARGKIVNESDVIIALRKKIIAGYATDVLDCENELTDKKIISPLLNAARKNNNILITPHIGGMTFESRMMTDLFITHRLILSLRKVDKYKKIKRLLLTQ